MADKVKLILQKRTSLKSQITNLSNLLDKGKLDNATLKLRIDRLTELYHACEEFNDELAILDPNDTHQDEFINIQERFYALAGKIENIMSGTNASGSKSSDQSRVEYSENRAVIDKKRRIKLPEATLPTFDGKFESWLSFKNAFHNMIGAQTDPTSISSIT